MTLSEMFAAASAATEGMEVSETKTFSPIKPGTYNLVVTRAEGPKESRSTNPTNPMEHGQYISITYTVADGEYQGRLIFANNNILVYPKSLGADDVRKAQMAMSIGMKERNILLASIGKANISTAEELVGATCVGKIVITKDNNGRDKNEVKTIMSASGTKTTAVSQPATIAQPSVTATPTSAKLPWMK